MIAGQVGCRGQRHRPEVIPAGSTDTYSDTRNHQLTLLSPVDITQRPKVPSIQLDDADFRVNALRLGLQDYLLHESIVLSFELPELADYLEILRCPANALIFGGSDLINNVELGSGTLGDEVEVFARNDFWEASVNIGKCVLAATSYRDHTFEDTTAPTGQWVYLVRACADSNRMTGNVHKNCSRQITKTRSINYTNRRSRKALKDLAQANSLRNEIDGIGRQIVDLTGKLHQLLFNCQQRNNIQIASIEQKQAMSTVIGLGAGAGLGAAAVGAFAIRKSHQHRTSSSQKIPGGIPATYKAIGSVMMISTAAYVTSLIYRLASDPPTGYPSEPIQCDRGGLQWLSQNLDEQASSSSCSCTGAVHLRLEIKRLAGELEYRIRLRDVRLGAVADAEPAQETPQDTDEKGDPDDITKR